MLLEKGQAWRKKIDAEIERLRQSAAQYAESQTKNRHSKLGLLRDVENIRGA